MAKSKVAILKTQPDRVFQDIERLMDLADMRSALEPTVHTILKDNISWHYPYLGANTTPWQLEGTILGLKQAGYEKCVAVHNNTVVTDPHRGQKFNKLDPIYQRYRIEERYNFKEGDISWIHYQPKARMRALHKVYGDNIMIPEYFIGKNIVHLPTVKTHIYTTTTGAMKNAFGGLLNTKRHYTHSWIHETLVDLLAIQKEIHTGIFAIMDGTICGNGPGPRTLIPLEKDYMIASADQVAIDAVAAKIMGFDPLSIKYIQLAHEDGLGCGDVRDIDVIGADISNVNFNFHVGDNAASKVGDMIWFGPFRSVQKLFFHTPLVYVFVFGSFFYHDWLWWPLKGRGIQNQVKRDTKWGRLFAEYESNSAVSHIMQAKAEPISS